MRTLNKFYNNSVIEYMRKFKINQRKEIGIMIISLNANA